MIVSSSKAIFWSCSVQKVSVESPSVICSGRQVAAEVVLNVLQMAHV